MLGQPVEPDPEHQLGAAARPAAFGFDRLQALVIAADIYDHRCAVRRQDGVEVIQHLACLCCHIGDVAGLTGIAPLTEAERSALSGAG